MANILLAEDDSSMRQFLAAALEKAGHGVSACVDGLAALALLEQEGAAFDLLLTDIVMPGLDGIELSYRARKLFPDIKVLYISGFTGTDGADPKSAMLSKPFHLSQLIMHVERLLQS